MNYHAMYKYRLAQKAGVSSRTFSRWLKTDQAFLQAQGISPSVHLLPPQAVRYLCEKYDIDLEDSP